MLDNRMTSALRRAGATLALVAATLTTACADNIFDGPGGGRTPPPEIIDVIGPTRVNAGDTIDLQVIATSQRPIDSVHVTLTAGSTVRDTAILLSSPSTSINEVFEIPLPSTLSGTSLDVSVVVADAQNTSEPTEITIEIEDRSDPVVQILDPPPGDTVGVGTGTAYLVRARVSDESGIAEVTMVGVGLRGDPDLGTGEEIVRFSPAVIEFPGAGSDTLPSDTIVRRFLQQTGQGNELVHVIVTATDLFGNVSADTAFISLGGPNVVILTPQDGQAYSNTLPSIPVRVAITDSAGLESLTLQVSGIIEREYRQVVTGTSDTITFVIPGADYAGLQGQLILRAEGRNQDALVAPSPTVTIVIQPADAGETVPPTLAGDVDPISQPGAGARRREMLDSVRVHIQANDASGLAEAGVIVNATLNGGTFTSFERVVALGGTPQTDTVISIAVQDLYLAAGVSPASVSMPDPVDLELIVFAEDVNGNGDSLTINTELLTVAGYTARLPGGGIISDAAIDSTAGRESLYLSNFTQSRVDVLVLADSSFRPGGILAGAQPWGLFINDVDGSVQDTLIVANSGGTNLSKIPLWLPSLAEDVSSRVHTPEAVIYQLDRELDDQLNPRFAYQFFGFSDRPQFVAQAVSDALLYSTVPTVSAAGGTIRMALKQPGWLEYEDYFLFPGGDPSNEADFESFLILNADRVVLIATDTGDLIRIVDHVPGFPASPIDVIGSETTVFDMAWAAGSDVVKCAGSFNAEAVALQDTTFVAASGDESWIAFGEGATADAGRVIMFDGSVTTPLDPFCLATGQSHEIQITDLVHNASERVTGLGLNNNGTLGVARGDFAAYYFDRSLRLEGLYSEDINPGGYGAALHPDHAAESGGSTPATLSFVGTAESTVKIIDTYHFFARGEIPIRDPIVGPLRATRPLPSDNAGLTCPADDRCVVVKLFAVTQSEDAEQPDGVVIIDVREGDID